MTKGDSDEPYIYELGDDFRFFLLYCYNKFFNLDT